MGFRVSPFDVREWGGYVDWCVGIVLIEALSNLPALLVHQFKSSLVIVLDKN